MPRRETTFLGMKIIKYISYVALFALLVGCATTFHPWKLSEVEEGMDRAQVVALLGEPEFVEKKDGAEFLHYAYTEDDNPTPEKVYIQSTDTTRTFREQQLKRSFKEYKYAVKMVDGRVLDYKDLTD